MHFYIWTESNRKKRGLNFTTECEYTTEIFGGLQKKHRAFSFIALSVKIDT